MKTKTRRRITRASMAALAIAALMGALAVQAAEIKVFSAVGFKLVMSQAVPRFERASGNKVRVTYGTLGQIEKRLQKGEAADVIVIPRQGLDAMARDGKVEPAVITPIARSVVGMAVRKGMPKPDISTTDGFRNAMLEAKSVSTVDPASGGVSGMHFRTLFERLAIAEQMKPKLRYRRAGSAGLSGGPAARHEVALNQMQDLTGVAGLEIVGPLPDELQLKTVFAAAATSTKNGAASRALVAYLGGPEVAAIIRAKGLQPVGP
jgi:molybdate transport system substrate-binding protein